MMYFKTINLPSACIILYNLELYIPSLYSFHLYNKKDALHKFVSSISSFLVIG